MTAPRVRVYRMRRVALRQVALDAIAREELRWRGAFCLWCGGSPLRDLHPDGPAWHRMPYA